MRKDVERCFGQLKNGFKYYGYRRSFATSSKSMIHGAVSCFTQYTHTATTFRDYNSRFEAVNVGLFEEQDAAVVQAWHERDVEDAEYYAHRLAKRQASAGAAQGKRSHAEG